MNDDGSPKDLNALRSAIQTELGSCLPPDVWSRLDNDVCALTPEFREEVKVHFQAAANRLIAMRVLPRDSSTHFFDQSQTVQNLIDFVSVGGF